MFLGYHRHASDEAWEKHLPKPIYLIYAGSILLLIILLNIFSEVAFKTLDDKSIEVLEDYTSTLEYYQEITKENGNE